MVRYILRSSKEKNLLTSVEGVERSRIKRKLEILEPSSDTISEADMPELECISIKPISEAKRYTLRSSKKTDLLYSVEDVERQARINRRIELEKLKMENQKEYICSLEKKLKQVNKQNRKIKRESVSIVENERKERMELEYRLNEWMQSEHSKEASKQFKKWLAKRAKKSKYNFKPSLPTIAEETEQKEIPNKKEVYQKSPRSVVSNWNIFLYFILMWFVLCVYVEIRVFKYATILNYIKRYDIKYIVSSTQQVIDSYMPYFDMDSIQRMILVTIRYIVHNLKIYYDHYYYFMYEHIGKFYSKIIY
jgi:hypothetical protein